MSDLEIFVRRLALALGTPDVRGLAERLSLGELRGWMAYAEQDRHPALMTERTLEGIALAGATVSNAVLAAAGGRARVKAEDLIPHRRRRGGDPRAVMMDLVRRVEAARRANP